MSETVLNDTKSGEVQSKPNIVSTVRTEDDTIIAESSIDEVNSDKVVKNDEPKKAEAQKVEEKKEETTKQNDPKYGDLPQELHRFQDSYAKNGKLTDEDYSELQKMGIPKSVADDHVKMRQRLHELEVSQRTKQAQEDDNAVIGTIGGIEEFNSLKGWATEKLSDDEKTAFNKIMNSGDLAARKLAMSGLHARFRSENPKEPRLVSGSRASSGETGYASEKDWLNEMRDYRYKTSPAFRAKVDKKLAASKF